MKQRLARYLKAIAQSFYSPPLYREVVTQWKGFGGLYLLVLSGAMALVLATIMAYGSMEFRDKELPHLAAQLPKLTVTDGKISIEGPQPAKVSSSNGMVLVYIDTTKSEEELRKQADNKVMMLVGKDFALIRMPTGFDKKTFENVKKFEISGKQLLENWPSPVAVLIAVWLLGTCGQFIGLLFMAVAVGVCSYIVTAAMREEYDFETRMRMAAVAMTPATLLSKGLLLFANHNTGTWFDVLLSVLYFYVMVVLMRRPEVAEK